MGIRGSFKGDYAVEVLHMVLSVVMLVYQKYVQFLRMLVLD